MNSSSREMSMNKVILYIATSLDGFIADSKGGVDWLPSPNELPNDLEDILGFKALMQRIGAIVMGSHSYQQILTFGPWAWSDKHTYVFTSQPLTSDLHCIEFTNDHPKIVLEKIKMVVGNKDIWLLGGAQLTRSFARDNLIDEVILTIIPTRLGQGISLDLSDNYYLSAEKPYIDGIVQKIYFRKG